MEYSLNSEDVKNIIKKPTHIVRLKDHCKLYDILNNDENISRILLHYQAPTNGDTIQGHWCALLIDKKRKIMNYYDSYGKKVDNSISKLNTRSRAITDQDDKYVDMFLTNAMNKGYKIYYNDNQHQRLSKNINTCGRFAGSYLKYGGSIDKFNRFINGYKNNFGYRTLDDAIVGLTKNMI